MVEDKEAVLRIAYSNQKVAFFKVMHFELTLIKLIDKSLLKQV